MARPQANPDALRLLVTRTTTGLRFTSPQLPGWGATARGAVPIARAVDAAMTELATARYAARRGSAYDLAVWDLAATSLADSGASLGADDVVVVRASAVARRQSGAIQRPGAVNGARHSPWSWTPLPDGRWQAPGGNIYPAGAQIVQRVIAARRERRCDSESSPQLTLDDVAS